MHNNDDDDQDDYDDDEGQGGFVGEYFGFVGDICLFHWGNLCIFVILDNNFFVESFWM